LAQQAGLTAQIDAKFGTAVKKSAYQYGTAYAYIDSLVREAGFEWHVAGSKLHVTPRAGSSATEVPVTVGDNLRRFNARVSATDHVGEVTVTGWDIVKKEAIVGVATSDGKGARSQVDFASAASVKKSAVAGKKALSIPRPVADQAEAKALATGIMHRREAGLLRARGEVIPEPAIIPGVQLVLEGLAGEWNGKYYCTEVEHVWGASEGSLRTFFEVGSAEPESLVDLFGGTGSASVDRMLGGLTVGIVTNNKDPEKLNRVKVKLPYLSDQEETSWARVLQPGAGKGRGWNVLPEVDDEVLIGFEHGDIDHPYVLGGLVNGKDKPPYLGADGDLLDSGKVAARTFSSRLGHEIYVADGSEKGKQYVKVKTAKDEATLFLGAERIDLESKGIPIKVFNDKGSIEITKDGDITIKGNKITLDARTDVIIKAKDLKADTKVHMNLNAGGEFKAAGRLGGTLDGGLTAKIKGGMVNIN
jgi:phage baseplate assembly protein gpV